ncbi:unnamed protein product [Phytophthora fragariaefolia]|uniref:Unnamed protein product n=1 Tax=Phytophthora fragariaefolia TaxID=1490495 RepID=A0A9W6XII4_9STRA|nr:unnamed protein product [Phytophthora fragariaefolia]
MWRMEEVPSSEDTRSSSPLDGDPERVWLKTTPELCVLAYVGPELRSKSQDNHQCMTVISENDEYLSDLPRPDQPRLEEGCPDNNCRDDPTEFRLGPGQRYGWWEEHNSDETKKVAVVQGKITLGPRVVYVMELWVANIGKGVDVLLGMNFMYSAGVRPCDREELVKLPDEERVLLAGRTADHMGRGLDLAVTPKTCLYLGPGELAVVRKDFGQSNPRREVVWAGRGDRWVIQIIYVAKSWPVAVKVVNISDKTVWIDSRTAVARIVEFGFFLTAGRFVRPGLRRYKEWQELIYENTNSREVRKREERLAQLWLESEPPCVRTSEYRWPKKLLVRSPSGSAQVNMVRLQPRPNVEKEKSPAKTDVQLSETEISGTPDSEGTESREAKLIEGTGGSHEDSGYSGEILEDRGPVVVLDEDSDSDDEAFYDAVRFNGDDGDDSPEVVRAESSTGSCSDWRLLLVRRLKKEYEWCMQMSAEELSLEPACDINKADVGEPGRTTPAEEEKLRTRLRYHHRIFLGYGTAAPASARGVLCDLDVRDAKPVAQRPRSIAPHQAIKGYESLKKRLETGRIEHSASPWASPIVIGLTKNRVDIRMCIDYRVVNGFIQLSNYPLPLIDDLSSGLSPEEVEVDQDVLEFLRLDPSKREDSGSQVSALTDTGRFSRGISRLRPLWVRFWDGIRVQDLPFPKTLKSVQSFWRSLNYYHKFIEDFPVVAAVLYELSDDQVRSERDLTRAKAAFEILKKKIVSTPLLRHPDRSMPFVIIPHANRWAACAVLGQEHDGKIQPVRFTGRVLNDAELRYYVAEKEVIAVLRVLEVLRTLLEGCRLEVHTGHSVFKWILQSKTADGRCVPCGVILSHRNITVRKVQRDEDGLAAIMGAGINPREHMDEVAELLIPAKGRVRKPPVLSVEMLDDSYQGMVLSFDGAAKTSTRRGSCGCILW